MLAYVGPMLGQRDGELSKNASNMSFFPFRASPWTPKPRKTRGFLIAPRWNSGTAKGTKHRKTRRFLTPRAEYTVNYKGSGDPEVTPPGVGGRGGSPL